MLHLRVYGPAESLTRIGEALEDHGAARNVALAPGVRAGKVLLTAEVSAGWADSVLELLVERGVDETTSGSPGSTRSGRSGPDAPRP